MVFFHGGFSLMVDDQLLHKLVYGEDHFKGLLHSYIHYASAIAAKFHDDRRP